MNAYCGKCPILIEGRVTEAELKQGKRETPAKADPSPFPLCGQVHDTTKEEEEQPQSLIISSVSLLARR
jgi:hypothetical protein